jgi:hypothetical protein
MWCQLVRVFVPRGAASWSGVVVALCTAPVGLICFRSFHDRPFRPSLLESTTPRPPRSTRRELRVGSAVYDVCGQYLDCRVSAAWVVQACDVQCGLAVWEGIAVFGRDKKLEKWTQEREGYANLLQTAMTFRGTTASDLMLTAGEAVFYKVTGCSLIGDRKTAGHWEGRSSGVSIPVGSIGGRSVRYRVGAGNGHYVQGVSKPTAVDTGTVYITNKRVIFQGSRQTRECQFAKLIGFHHDDQAGSTTFSVSNRQTPTTVHYGPSLSAAFDFRLDLALAHYKGTLASLVRQLQGDLARIDAARPS